MFARAVWLILRKDLTVEFRSGEIAYTTLFFAVSCILMFAFALVREGKAPEDGAAGLLWIAIAFAGTLALGRTFERERQTETLRALLLAPVERTAVYLGKLIGVLGLLAIVEALLLPFVGLIFQAPLWRAPGLLLAILASGTVGFAAVGTLFAAMLVRAESRDVLLPVVLYPVTLPALVGGMQGTAAIFAAEPNLVVAQTWLSMLIFFDVVFITLTLWTFAPVMSE